MHTRQDELRLAAWQQRRTDETRAMLSQGGRTTSMDGKCLLCRGDLYLVERQPHLSRDWARCSYCGNTMAVAEGVL